MISKSKGEIWTDEERDAIKNKRIPFLTVDKKSVVFTAYSEVKWSTSYAEDQFSCASTSSIQTFNAHQWYRNGETDNAIKGDQYLNSYYLHPNTKVIFDSAYKSYICNKDDWDYEEDAFIVLNDTLGQISDLCYESIHFNLAIIAATVAPFFDLSTDECLDGLENKSLDEMLEMAVEVNINKIPVQKTDLAAREKARTANHDAKNIILSYINDESETTQINKELNHYHENALFQGKFRLLQICRFLMTPSDLIDFMIKDENAEADPGIEFFNDFFTSEGYSGSKFYNILIENVEFQLKDLSKIHYDFWMEAIDVLGAIAIYNDITYGQKRFLSILHSLNIKNGDFSCMYLTFLKSTKHYHVEDYILDISEEEKKAYEEKYGGVLPLARRFIYPETEFTRDDIWAQGFDVKELWYNYRGLKTMDDLNDLRDLSIKLYDLVASTNRKVAAWVSEDVLNDEDASARTVCFTNLQDYGTHILKRKFGITGDNPNGIVFPDKNTGELLYTGIVIHNTTVDNYKVYAMPYDKIQSINCVIGLSKCSTSVKKYLRLSENGTVHGLVFDNPIALKTEPYNIDGTINSAFVKHSQRGSSILLSSKYVSDREKSQIIVHSIHQAQEDFINHPVTKGAIFILTTVMTAGISSSFNLGGRALIYTRNAYGRLSQMTAKQVVKTVAKAYVKKKSTEYVIDASRSITYQSLVEKRINFVTVAMDTFINPWVGEFVGNAFFVGIDFNEEDNYFKIDSIFDKGITKSEVTSFFIKSSIKALLNGTIGVDKVFSDGFGMMGTIPYDYILHAYVVRLDNMNLE